jgi:CheY-like chemotaxis protein
MSWKPVVLCVDDTPSALEGQKMLLEENGYRVTATNGKEAVQVFTSHSVDLVLLDYHMPEMNGGMAAVRIKDSKPDVPVALLSGDECLPSRDLEVVDCFIPKFEPIVSLLEKVDYLLSQRFLFRPFDALNLRAAGERVNAHQGGPDSERPNGISMQKGGITRRSTIRCGISSRPNPRFVPLTYIPQPPTKLPRARQPEQPSPQRAGPEMWTRVPLFPRVTEHHSPAALGRDTRVCSPK